MSLEDVVLKTVRDVSRFFNIPPPTVEFADIEHPGMYVDGKIVISTKLSPEDAVRVAVHEVAHHSHHFYGIPCTTDECEAFASMFERIWLRMKGDMRGSTVPCARCGYPILRYSSRCLRCGYQLPGSADLAVIAFATLSALALLISAR